MFEDLTFKKREMKQTMKEKYKKSRNDENEIKQRVHRL